MKHDEGHEKQRYSAPRIETINLICEQPILVDSILGSPGEDPDLLDWGEF